jgi:hypothetical protein
MPWPLPIEIVEYILDLAGAFPDLTTYLSPPYSLYYDIDHDLPLSAIQLSARTLFSLVLVCRQWNAICTPRLYRCLAIADSTAIDTLIRTLEHSQATGGILPLGYLTHHLIVALSDSPVNDSDTERLETRIQRRFGNLGRLARCLPRLEILSISIYVQDTWGLPPPYYGKDFAATVTQTFAHSLLKLHLHHDPFVLFSRQELRNFLASAPNLAAITGAGVGDSIGCPVALPYLPKLKYLAVNSERHCHPGRVGHEEDDQTPFLDYIHIRLSSRSNYYVHLLSVQGAKITSVSLDLRLSVDPKKCSDCLSMLTGFCHNLSYLEICIDSWLSFPRLEPLPPVERLGIRVHVFNTSVSAIFKSLATMQSPSLKVVQLMNPGMFEEFASPPSDNVAWNPLLYRTFRVVDCDGRGLGPSGQSTKKGRSIPIQNRLP